MTIKSSCIDLTGAHKEIFGGHLKLGGANPHGDTLAVTNYYVTLNDRPFFIICGEFHYSRTPEAYWEEELLKMKAGGVNVVATYVFWIHHEADEGVFDWSGNRCLRRFVEICGRLGLYVIARIGPFAHGECRNGGLPDWLYGQPFEVRSNAPGYLGYVQRLYQEIGSQLRGQLFKDGGPVIAIQLENEYGHSSAPWEVPGRDAETEWLHGGTDGIAHLACLKELALEAGLDAPLWTITAWGNPNWAPILEDESLPVYGGYAYPVWIENPGPSDLYLFRDAHAEFAARPGLRICYYPVINAEMQGGIQVRYNNRPVVPPRSTEALALIQIGSGSNFLGYYVFHGGSNPDLPGSGFANERLHPQASYDFQAPIGEFGEVRDAYRYLKTLHLFTETFGAWLASMGVVLPPGAAAIRPADLGPLRWSVRVKDDAGFIFLNNFQDHLEAAAQTVRLELKLEADKLTIPRSGALTLPGEACCLLPFNLPLGGARLVYATAQPLTCLETLAETHYFFFAPAEWAPEYCFDPATLTDLAGEMLATDTADGHLYVTVQPGAERSFTFQAADQIVRVTTLTRAEAENTWRGAAWGRERVIISPADLLFHDGGVEAHRWETQDMELLIYPSVEGALTPHGGSVHVTPGPYWTHCRLRAPARTINAQLNECGAGRFQLDLPADLMNGLNDVFLQFDYTGDVGRAFIAGRLIADNYNNGLPWVIGLKRFIPAALEHGLTFYFRPLRRGQTENISTSMAGRVEFIGEEVFHLDGFRVIPEYAMHLVEDR